MTKIVGAKLKRANPPQKAYLPRGIDFLILDPVSGGNAGNWHNGIYGVYKYMAAKMNLKKRKNSVFYGRHD